MLFEHHYQRSRYELKYLIDEACARRVRDFVRPYLKRDCYANPAMRYAYPIYSLYLDDCALRMYREATQGQKNRFKLRVRYYDHKPTSPLFCEIKRRVNDVILKQRAMIKREALNRVLNGCCPSLDDVYDPDDAESYGVLREFCHVRNAMHADGRMIIYYEREAWVAPADDAVRVTFDRAAAAAHFDGSLNPQKWSDPRIDSVILELKFDDRYPLWMRDLAQACDLFRTKMGKYVQCTEMIPRPPRPFAHVMAAQ
jgi:SPX domain protein involved in polyphosphate accumulation